jgi:plastocyanin
MRRGIAVIAAALALAAPACRDQPKPVRAEGGRLSVALDDFLVRPQNVRAEVGRLTVEVVNRGAIGHNLHIRKGRRDLLEVPTLLPGRRARASGRLARGGYKLVCTVGNHEELGMYGTLTVR